MSPPAKSFSGVVVVIIIFLFIGVAVAFVYHGTIFKKSSPSDETNSPAAVAQGPATPPKPQAMPKKNAAATHGRSTIQ